MRDVSVSVLMLLGLAVAQIMGIQTHQDGMTSARNVQHYQIATGTCSSDCLKMKLRHHDTAFETNPRLKKL
jgi:hypothetical protein